MTDRPILFPGPMVRAILDDRKCQTRRVITPQPPVFNGSWYQRKAGEWMHDPNAPDLWHFVSPSGKENMIRPIRCRHGNVGDTLWVRETFTIETNFNVDDYPPPFADGRPVRRHTDPDYGSWWEQCHYRATDPTPELALPNNDEPGCRWQPSIHMPRWASRLTLEITDIHVERLTNMKLADVEREGVMPPNYAARETWDDPISEFKEVWNSINAKRGYGWGVNPWVWVISFRRQA